MKVAFVSWRDLASPSAGGSEVVVDRLITGLQARGHEGVLLCGGPVGARPYEVIETGGVYSQYLRAPFFARRLRDVDLLVDVANGMSFFAPLWWRRTPVMFLVHHVQGEMWHHFTFPKPVAHFGEQLEAKGQPVAYRRCEVVAVSPSTRDELVKLGFDRPRIHLMPNGIDEAVFSPAGTEPAESPEPLFVALGRLAPHKATGHLLDLWAQVQPVIGGRLVIAGDGPERASLEARQVPGVDFVGHVDERAKRELLASAWCLVHTARREGWGLVVMEAAAQCTPALSYDVMGLRDSIVDGTTGVRVPDAETFVKEWIRLAEDHARRRAMGEAARRRARTFTWDRSVEAFLDAAEVALAGRSNPVAGPARLSGDAR
jgi:glycosyltransferase involved in cell wall biosynthesis